MTKKYILGPMKKEVKDLLTYAVRNYRETSTTESGERKVLRELMAAFEADWDSKSLNKFKEKPPTKTAREARAEELWDKRLSKDDKERVLGYVGQYPEYAGLVFSALPRKTRAGVAMHLTTCKGCSKPLLKDGDFLIDGQVNVWHDKEFFVINGHLD